MGMSASQARYLNLIAQQSDLEFQGQQINESRTTLSEQTNNLYSQLQNLSVPTPPHTSEYTTIQYAGSLGADNFTLGKIVPSGSTYNVNLNYNKAGNSTISAGKAEIKEVPAKIKLAEVPAEEKSKTIADNPKLIGNNATDEETKDYQKILHQISKEDDISALGNDVQIFVINETGQFVKTDASSIQDDDINLGKVFMVMNAYDERTNEDGSITNVPNFVKGQDRLFEGNKEVNGFSNYDFIYSYYIQDSSGSVRHAKATDFSYDKGTGIYSFKNDVTYLKASSDGSEYDNPDYIGGIGKSLNDNPLMNANDGLNMYLTKDEKAAAIEALRNGFPEYSNLTDDALLAEFYVSFSTEGTLKIPHFTLKSEVDKTITNGSQTQWAEFHDITATGTYTKISSYENCQLTFDTSGRITRIDIPVTGSNGEIVYHKVELTATSVTDEAAYEDAYNNYEYSKYEYDREQLKINAQMSIIQEEDKKLELKLQRLDNERTQITTELEALKKVVGDNIEKTYKTFAG